MPELGLTKKTWCASLCVVFFSIGITAGLGYLTVLWLKNDIDIPAGCEIVSLSSTSYCFSRDDT